MILNECILLKKASAAMNIVSVLSIEPSSSFFKTVMVAFVYNEIDESSKKRNNIAEWFFSILHNKFLISKSEIAVYYEMLDKLVANDIIKSEKSYLFFEDMKYIKKLTKSKINIIKSVLQINDADFARLFIQYV